MVRYACTILGFLGLCMAGTASPAFYYSPKKPYKPMNLSDLQRGWLDIPPCAKALMNCWEISSADVFCKFVNATATFKYPNFVLMDNVCMDLRLQCTEPGGPAGFPPMAKFQTVYDYCGDYKAATTQWKFYNVALG